MKVCCLFCAVLSVITIGGSIGGILVSEVEPIMIGTVIFVLVAVLLPLVLISLSCYYCCTYKKKIDSKCAKRAEEIHQKIQQFNAAHTSKGVRCKSSRMCMWIGFEQ